MHVNFESGLSCWKFAKILS